MRLKFKLRTIPLIATVILVAVGIALGQWQTRRALQKETIQAQLLTRAADPVLVLGSERQSVATIEYRRVRVHGEFRADWPLYLDNRPYNGAPGFYLLMPFKIAGSDRYILVERGWTPRNSEVRTQMRQINTPTGLITIEGVA
ncbi:MAG: SURF1 family protein, partial [Herbaspirillum sp.]